MDVIARHQDGTKSQWQSSATEWKLAREEVFHAVLAETGSEPRVVLALLNFEE